MVASSFPRRIQRGSSPGRSLPQGPLADGPQRSVRRRRRAAEHSGGRAPHASARNHLRRNPAPHALHDRPPAALPPVAGDSSSASAQSSSTARSAPCSTTQTADFRVDASDVPSSPSISRPRRQPQARLHRRQAALEVGRRSRRRGRRPLPPGRMIYASATPSSAPVTSAPNSSPQPRAPASSSRSRAATFPPARASPGPSAVSGKKGRRNGDIGCEVQPSPSSSRSPPKSATAIK